VTQTGGIRSFGAGAALLALAAVACVHQDDPLPLSAGTIVEGRSLTLRIETRPEAFNVCARINSNQSSFYLTSGLRYQLLYSLTDGHGRPTYPKSAPFGFMPSLPPNPPPPGSGWRYSVIGMDEVLETCGSYRYSDFEVDRIHIRAQFTSWLRRDEVLEEPVQANIARGFVSRPLYLDEPLASNSCVIDRKAKKAQCG
jgi:hypothetical protein